MPLAEAIDLPPSISADPAAAQPLVVEAIQSEASPSIPDDVLQDAMPTASHGVYHEDSSMDTGDTINSTAAERISKAPSDSPLNVVGWDE